jgi:uncharacterized protein (TIGR02118 family)
MATTITVLYPAASDATFDFDYYTNTYMPMVLEKLRPYGMTGYRVSKLVSGVDPSVPLPYSVCCTLDFSSGDSIQKGLQAEGADIIGHVQKFSNKQSLMMIGSVIAESS